MTFDYLRVLRDVEGSCLTGNHQRLLTFAHAVRVSLYEPNNERFLEVVMVAEGERGNSVRRLFEMGWRAVSIEGRIGFRLYR